MAPLERNAAAVEIIKCVALVLGAVLFVVGNRVVGILLVTRIRLLRRWVHADADDLLARMAHAEIRMQQTTLSLGEEAEPAHRSRHVGPNTEAQRRLQLEIRKQHAPLWCDFHPVHRQRMPEPEEHEHVVRPVGALQVLD